MKILYVTTISDTIGFLISHIEMLQDLGHTVDVACNINRGIDKSIVDKGCTVYNISFQRSPFSMSNFKAYKDLKQLIIEENYDIVHTHTPIASMFVRIARLSLKSFKVIYTAHGFHFYNSAPLKNWLLFYPIEYVCSFWTDILITINSEDFLFAKKHLKSKKIRYIPGIGLDIDSFRKSDIDVVSMRSELGVPKNAKLLISVGELNKNKNHETVIKAIKGMGIYYLIAGEGYLKEPLKELIVREDLAEYVKLLGFRDDVSNLYRISDAFIFPSLREGLPVSLMEAMASGMPCIVSNIRGNMDLIDRNGGILFNSKSIIECRNAIEKFSISDSKRFGEYNRKKVKDFSKDKILSQIAKLYKEVEET